MVEVVFSSSWQFILLLFSQHQKKLNNKIKTTSEKGMQGIILIFIKGDDLHMINMNSVQISYDLFKVREGEA